MNLIPFQLILLHLSAIIPLVPLARLFVQSSGSGYCLLLKVKFKRSLNSKCLIAIRKSIE